ncbi:MAG: DUF6913 domain-containing protein [Bacteroidota bacterium]
MFKLSFLKMRTESALKKNKVPRASVPYKHAQSIGIIFSVEDRQKHDLIKDMVKHFEQDGKKVQVLEFLPKKKENYEFLFDFFTIENLSFWGKINSEQATRFSNTPFDYLFYVDAQSNPLVLNLLAQSKAHCRVGQYHEEESRFFELMIEAKNELRSLVDNMYKYTKQLK